MLRVGLTGGIGAGKSAVAGLLVARGAILIDADVLAREVVEPGTAGLAAVVDRFGAGVLALDGRLDRAALARTIFDDVAARQDLEAIVHPLVRARAAALEAAAVAADASSIVVHDIPLLVETGQAGDYDVVVVVDVTPEVQLERLLRTRGMSPAAAQARIAAQATRAERLAAADEVIDNSGDLAALEAAVDRLWLRFRARSGYRPD